MKKILLPAIALTLSLSSFADVKTPLKYKCETQDFAVTVSFKGVAFGSNHIKIVDLATDEVMVNESHELLKEGNGQVDDTKANLGIYQSDSGAMVFAKYGKIDGPFEDEVLTLHYEDLGSSVHINMNESCTKSLHGIPASL